MKRQAATWQERQELVFELRGPWFCAPGRDRLFGEPHRQAATLAQGSIIFRPVRHPILLLRNVVTAIGIGLEWHDGHLRGFWMGGSTLPSGMLNRFADRIAVTRESMEAVRRDRVVGEDLVFHREILLSVALLELFHVVDQRADAFDRHCVVNRCAHTADGAMTL